MHTEASPRDAMDMQAAGLIAVDKLTLDDFGLGHVLDGERYEVSGFTDPDFFVLIVDLLQQAGCRLWHRLQQPKNGCGTPFPVLTVQRLRGADKGNLT